MFIVWKMYNIKQIAVIFWLLLVYWQFALKGPVQMWLQTFLFTNHTWLTAILFLTYTKNTLALIGATLIWCAKTLSFNYGLNSSHHALNYGLIMTMRRNNTVGNGVYINISQALLDFISYLCWTSIWFNKMCVGWHPGRVISGNRQSFMIYIRLLLMQHRTKSVCILGWHSVHSCSFCTYLKVQG